MTNAVLTASIFSAKIDAVVSTFVSAAGIRRL